MRSPLRTLAASVLVAEALVLFFATLVALRLPVASPSTVWWVGGGLIAACVVAAGLVRSVVGLVLGSVLQVVMIACGAAVTMMYVMGLVFAAIWVAALMVGRKIERERAEFVARGGG